MLHETLTHRVIASAFQVHNALGPGLPESVYQRAMLVELRRQGIRGVREVSIPIQYRNVPVGQTFGDHLVEYVLLLELKAKLVLTRADAAQLLTGLKFGGYEVGLVLNFGGEKVEVMRRVMSRGRELGVRMNEDPEDGADRGLEMRDADGTDDGPTTCGTRMKGG
jgi:GxxExxY protein